MSPRPENSNPSSQSTGPARCARRRLQLGDPCRAGRSAQSSGRRPEAELREWSLAGQPGRVATRPAPRASRLHTQAPRTRPFLRSSPSTGGRAPDAFTLVEVLIAATITTVVALVLTGLALGVQRTWSLTGSTNETLAQGRAALERIEYSVRRAGVYRLPGRPSRVGLAVVCHNFRRLELPDVLVVWCGGREGDLSQTPVLERLPRLNELLVYTWDPDRPSHLVEIAFDQTSPIDFDGAFFDWQIRRLVRRSSAKRRVLLSDRLRSVVLPRVVSPRRVRVGLVRFELRRTPDDELLAELEPGSPEWFELPWAAGVVSETSGLRQATVRVELQLTAGPDAGDSPSRSVPFFAAIGRRHVYLP